MSDEKRIGRPTTRDEETIQDQVRQAIINSRKRLKEKGYKAIYVHLPKEYKALMDEYCNTTGLSQRELICYFLDCARSKEVAEIYPFPKLDKGAERHKKP